MQERRVCFVFKLDPAILDVCLASCMIYFFLKGVWDVKK